MEQLTASIHFLLDDGTINTQLDRLTSRFKNFQNQFTLNNFLGEFNRLNQVTTKFREQIEKLEQSKINLSFFGQNSSVTLNQIERLNDKIQNTFLGKIDRNFLNSLSRLGIQLNQETTGSNLFTQIIEQLRSDPNRNDNIYLRRILEPLGLFNSSIIQTIRANEEEYNTRKKISENTYKITAEQEKIISNLSNRWEGIKEAVKSTNKAGIGEIAEFTKPITNWFTSLTEKFLTTKTGQLFTMLGSTSGTVLSELGFFKKNFQGKSLEENVASIAGDVRQMNNMNKTSKILSFLASKAPSLGIIDTLLDKLGNFFPQLATQLSTIFGSFATIFGVGIWGTGVAYTSYEAAKARKKDINEIDEIGLKYYNEYKSGRMTAREAEEARKQELKKRYQFLNSKVYRDIDEVDELQAAARKEKRYQKPNIRFTQGPSQWDNKIELKIENKIDGEGKLKNILIKTKDGTVKEIDPYKYFNQDVQINNAMGVQR